ncbi:MAG: ATP-binding cassette domain-containing protein [Eubacteriales bacterium]|nr:ATP-binding cassette domain-containing protein [Eubacteriales bacterium]
MSLITCKNITLGYAGKVVVENINLSIEEADYLCILGENGTGKSTLIKALLSMNRPMNGTIEFSNDFSNRDIGYLPQLKEHQSDFPANVFEIVITGTSSNSKSTLFYSKADKDAAYKAMKLFNILDIKNKQYIELSGGQKQRVLLARALCASKRVLLLDEPVTGLDHKITKELYSLIASLNKEQKITMIMVSHDVDSSLKYANKILHLGTEGHFFGTKEEYIDSEVGKKYLRGKMI